MRYGDGLLEEIRRRTDLVQLVGRRVKLMRKGRVMWGCCPFHAEKSASFKVENERHAYKCFGCGAGGDAFKWLIETEGLTFPEAVEKLAGEAGVELPKWSPDDEAREQKRKSLYEIVELAAQFYEAQLREPQGQKARDYLKRRGLDGQAAKQFRLGFAPNSSQALIEFLKGKNITQDDMLAAGLARSSDGQPLRDFFFNRVMFAITDGRGRVIAFGGRALEDDAKPKYINSGENSLFSKGTQLYNFATARAASIKAGTIIVAEGYMDVIALVRGGFAHAVAPLGTALTEDQLHLLWRTTPEPVLSFDGDAAGAKAAERAARLALPHLKAGYSLRFAFMPTGEDPDSLIGKSGPRAMTALLDQAMPLSDMLWRIETEGKDFATPERRAGLERVLSGLIAEIADTKVADYYRRDFEQRIFEKFKRRPPSPRRPDQNRPFRNPGFQGSFRQGPPRPQPGTAEAVSPAVKASLLARAGQAGKARDAALTRKEAELALLLLEQPGLALRHGELLAELAFQDRSLDRLRHELLNLAAAGSSLEKTPVLTHLERLGMADLLAQLGVRSNPRPPESVPEDETEARFLRAAADFRAMAEWEPERERALRRFASEGSEESWQEASRFLRSSHE
ncbi:MAG TPA: DNA primase [Rhizomicrobium sp.]|jgi:DNA primase|nr:DNA primase [Rhizomicrobium sp.]